MSHAQDSTLIVCLIVLLALLIELLWPSDY